jgi:hypothetical protein
MNTLFPELPPIEAEHQQIIRNYRNESQDTKPVASFVAPWEHASLSENPKVSALDMVAIRQGDSWISWGFVVLIVVIIILVLVAMGVVIAWLVTPPGKDKQEFEILQSSSSSTTATTTAQKNQSPQKIRPFRGPRQKQEEKAAAGQVTRPSMIEQTWWDPQSKTSAVQIVLETESPVQWLQFFLVSNHARNDKKNILWSSQVFQPPVGLSQDWTAFSVQRFYLPISKSLDSSLALENLQLVLKLTVRDKIHDFLDLEATREVSPSWISPHL